MEKKLKNFIMERFEIAKDEIDDKGLILNLRGQAFGALEFYQIAFGFDDELADWWNEDMLQRFRELMD